MDTAQFLARVTPPGNYIAIGYDRGPTGEKHFTNEFFVAGDYRSAAGLLQWASRKNFNAYHAMASFRLATPSTRSSSGGQRYKGERKATNAQQVKAFWIDLDIKREGDKKADTDCYADLPAALSWAGQFRKAVGLPKPNLAVNSGYGLHLYWLLEDPLSVEDWTPQAHAFRAAMVANGFKGDSGVSIDAARVLRPPGTVNIKVAGHPVPVVTIDALNGPDVVNGLMLQALQPWLGQVDMRARNAFTTSANVSALVGGVPAQVVNVFQSRVAAHTGTGPSLPNMNAAAQANLPTRSEPKRFELIAQQCGQVAHSLAQHGNGDGYPVWYLGHLALAHFTEDGAKYVHEISDGDPRYDPAKVDAAVTQLSQEINAKGLGPPTCAHYEGCRSAICHACPHFGRITSPIVLGVPQSDLPPNYRRNAGCIQVRRLKADGDEVWLRVLGGDIENPRLYRVGRDVALGFTHVRAGERRSFYVTRGELPDEGTRLRKLFSDQGVHVLPSENTLMRDLIMAFIDDLIEKRVTKITRYSPWGWAEDEKGIAGFAVGGVLYRTDGTEVEVALPPEAVQMQGMYQPRGKLEKWQEAFDFVCQGKVPYQVIVAAAFAAPLMKLTGYSGTVVSAWTQASGIGKTSAMLVGQSVWASSAAMFALNDTANASLGRVALTKAMPVYWDETRVLTTQDAVSFSRMIFEITQGKERARMRADTTLREVRTWETVLLCAGNRPLMDQVIAQDEGTSAGALRLFEFELKMPRIAAVPGAQAIVAQANSNYGRAGEVYARWLASNMAKAQKVVDHIAQDLAHKCGAQQEERLQFAAMTTLLAGAAIAAQLGIAKFDLAGMRLYLTQALDQLRGSRKRDTLAGNEGFDLDQLLSEFMSRHAGRVLITDRYLHAGRAKIKIEWRPAETREGIVVHVSQAEQAMRIDRNTFLTWCRERKLAGTQVVDAMVREWNATQGRHSLGGGCPGYMRGYVWTVEIPLHRPELQGYAAIPEQDSGTTRPAPAEGLRRNGLPSKQPEELRQ